VGKNKRATDVTFMRDDEEEKKEKIKTKQKTTIIIAATATTLHNNNITRLPHLLGFSFSRGSLFSLRFHV